MKACIFVGPSLPHLRSTPKLDVYPPAAMGSVFRAVEMGYQKIGIVDGIFGNSPAVWHKEILFALSRKCIVLGASSIGALRASELHRFGMIGVGVIFRLYKRGVIADDDEVCVTHAPAELSYALLTEPMINVRYTARRLLRSGYLSPYQHKIFVERTKNIFFADRSRQAVVSLLADIADRSADSVEADFCRCYVDVKQRDATALITTMSFNRIAEKVAWSFPATHHWRDHFEQKVDDIPPLLLSDREKE